MNILVSSHRPEDPDNDELVRWVESEIGSGEAIAVPSVVLSAFLRIVTNARAFRDPTPVEIALEHLEKLLRAPNVRVVEPGPSHWSMFVALCRRLQATGNTIPDVYLSAMAIEGGYVWVSLDRGFGTVPGLRWRDPLASR